MSRKLCFKSLDKQICLTVSPLLLSTTVGTNGIISSPLLPRVPSFVSPINLTTINSSLNQLVNMDINQIVNNIFYNGRFNIGLEDVTIENLVKSLDNQYPVLPTSIRNKVIEELLRFTT